MPRDAQFPTKSEDPSHYHFRDHPSTFKHISPAAFSRQRPIFRVFTELFFVVVILHLAVTPPPTALASTYNNNDPSTDFWITKWQNEIIDLYNEYVKQFHSSVGINADTDSAIKVGGTVESESVSRWRGAW